MIDMILAGRIKKYSINIPKAVPRPDETSLMRMRKFIIKPEKDWKHLMGECDGQTYESCARPELEIHVVESQKITQRQRILEKRLEYADDGLDGLDKDEENEEGRGWGYDLNPQDQPDQPDQPPRPEDRDIVILYDPSKHIYIMSELMEDFLLLRLERFSQNKALQELALTKCTCNMEKNTYNVLDNSKQRVWRRFVREVLKPMAATPHRMMEAHHRYYLPCGHALSTLATILAS